MRILFYIESFRSGGKERRLLALIKELVKESNWVIGVILDRRDIFYKEIFKLPVQIFYAERKRWKKDPRVFWKVFLITGRFNPDIICVWGNMPAIYSIPSKILRGIPMVNCQIVDAPPKEHDSWPNSKVTFLFSDRIIGNSKAGLAAYQAPKHKSHVIYSGFDFAREENCVEKSQIKDQFKIVTKYIVAMVATNSRLKDYPTYIAAAKNIISIRRDITFLCIGSGDFDMYYSQLSDTERSLILFTGAIHPVDPLVSICDIGVLTSNAWLHGEGISNSLLEFSGFGVPFIATDSGGNKEILELKDNWNIIPDQGVDELVEKIMYLIDNKEYRKSLGLMARQRVRDNFGIYRMKEEFKSIFQELIKT